MPRFQTAHRITMAAALAAGLVILPATSAVARPVDSGAFDVVDSGSFDDCGFTITYVDRLTGTYAVKDSTPKTGGQYFRVQQRASYAGTFTNPSTGAFFTETWHTTFKELPGTVISADGNVVTYRTHESGVWDVIRDSSGKVRYRNTGNLVFEYVYDTGGDAAPGGEILSEEFIRTSGRWDSFDADFCAIADELIG